MAEGEAIVPAVCALEYHLSVDVVPLSGLVRDQGAPESSQIAWTVDVSVFEMAAP
jgi:hypothetical protein